MRSMTDLLEVLIDTTAQQQQIVYSLNSQDTVFALIGKGTHLLCEYIRLHELNKIVDF